jgi:hypothetical protein
MKGQTLPTVLFMRVAPRSLGLASLENRDTDSLEYDYHVQIGSIRDSSVDKHTQVASPAYSLPTPERVTNEYRNGTNIKITFARPSAAGFVSGHSRNDTTKGIRRCAQSSAEQMLIRELRNMLPHNCRVPARSPRRILERLHRKTRRRVQGMRLFPISSWPFPLLSILRFHSHKNPKAEFETILQDRSVVPSLNTLDRLCSEARSRKSIAEASSPDGIAIPPIPPHTLPATSLLNAHLTPFLMDQETTLQNSLADIQTRNEGLVDEIMEQRLEIEALMLGLEGLVTDLERSGAMLQGDEVQGLSNDVRMIEEELTA